MKIISALIGILLVIFVLVPSVGFSAGAAQTKKEAIALVNEAGQLGSISRPIADREAALAKLQTALQVFKKIKAEDWTGVTFKYMGDVCITFMSGDKARENYGKAIEIFQRLKLRAWEAETLYRMGNAHGSEDKKREYYYKALVVFKQIGDKKGQANILSTLSGYYVAVGQYEKAVEYCDRELELYRKIGDTPLKLRSLERAGKYSAFGGLYQRALQYYEKELAVLRSSDPSIFSDTTKFGGYKRGKSRVPAEASILNDIGKIYSKLGYYQKALQHHKRALEILDKDGCKSCSEKAIALHQMGIAYQNIGQPDEALAAFQKGLETQDMAEIKESMGNLYLDRGELHRAEPLLREAEKKLSGLRMHRFYLLTANYTRAKLQYEILLQHSEEPSIPDWEVNRNSLFIACTGLGKVYEGLGDYKKAEEYYEKAIKSTEEVRSGLPPSERTHFFEGRDGGFLRTAPYGGLARVLMKLDKPLDALEESEYTKARVFAEALSKRSEASVPDIPKKVMDIDSQLNDELARLTKNCQNAHGMGDKEAAAKLEPQVKQAEEKLAIHIDMLRKQYPLFAATKYPQPIKLEQAALRDNEWVLAYHVTDPGVIMYLTRGRNLVKAEFKPVPRKEIDDLVRRFRASFEMAGEGISAATLAKFDFSSGKKLSDILLADILPDLPKDTPVIIIPDGSLG
ncbi:MAG: tetratricopeptide repeat protein, partial [Desulfomonilaceae bacterium]